MSGFVMTAVLFAALLHAAWNALVKAGGDTFPDTVRVACGAALVSAATLPFLALPAAQSWPCLIASAFIHVGYFALVAASYGSGDLSYAYPIMRGTAPLLTALAAAALIGDPLGAGGWAGILIICSAILLLAADQVRRGRFHLPQTLFALGTAAVICLYTLVDGIGSRLSGNAFSYVGWMLVLNAVLLVAFLSVRHRAGWVRQLRTRWQFGIGGGGCAWASYAIVLWAMTRAPLALVAALRETSVIFGAILAAVVLGEKFGGVRYAAALLVCAGAVCLKVF